jgi:hypothetical protein
LQKRCPIPFTTLGDNISQPVFNENTRNSSLQWPRGELRCNRALAIAQSGFLFGCGKQFGRNGGNELASTNGNEKTRRRNARQ